MNWGVIAWCDKHQIPVTRGRPYKHNDNAHIERRNGDSARKNHLPPCVKAIGWTQTKSGRKKRVYDSPSTRYRRLLDAGVLDAETRKRLETEHEKLNPARITRRINQLQGQIIDLGVLRRAHTLPLAFFY